MNILFTIIILMAQAALATFVLVRANDYQPARFFVAFIGLFATLNLLGLLSYLLSNPEQIYIIRSIHTITLGMLSPVLLWLLSHLFMPQWWQVRRRIILISLPYWVIVVALLVDLVGRFGWFVNGLNPNNPSTLLMVAPGGPILATLFSIGWLVHVIMLIFAFIKIPDARQSILWLVLSLIVTIAFTQINARIPLMPSSLIGLVTSIPILIALAYVVLRTSLLVPTRIALDLALQSLTDAVFVVDNNSTILYVNEHGNSLGFQANQSFTAQLNFLGNTQQTTSIHEAIAQGRQSELPVNIGDKHLIYTISPVIVIDRRARQRGTLLIGRDVTELGKRTNELEQRNAEQQRLLDLVATLEAPTIRLADGVLFAPIMGYLDSQRANTLTTRLLNAAYGNQTRAVILDITGVQALDSSVAHILLQMTVALRLLGCQVLISGVSASMATILVQQGNLLSGITTVRSPQEALESILQ